MGHLTPLRASIERLREEIGLRAARAGSILLSLSLVALALLWPASLASAAEGDPNLAYIAGSTPGVSVIDIGHHQQSRTFSVGGNPAMMYLSLNGSFLSLSQPSLNQVLVLATRTGQQVSCPPQGML
jgi:hypothetical protein